MSQDAIALVDFKDLVSRKTTLTHVGGSKWKGLSPFTTERTPSFTIDADAKIWYCFSSGQGGGVLKFIAETEGVPESEAYKILEEFVGIENSGTSSGPDYERRALRLAESFFHKNVSSISEYLEARHIGQDAVNKYRLGFGEVGLVEYLKEQGIPETSIESVGLAKRVDGRLLSTFENRLVIPFKDEFGAVVSFSGRALDNEIRPKYLHGVTTHIFQRRRILWGLFEARKLIQELSSVVVVEGQIDAMALMSVGIPAVAVLGSNITPEQMKLLTKMADHLYFCFDSDKAGEKGLLSVFHKSKDFNVESIIYSVVLPIGYDPSDFIHEFGEEAFRERMVEASTDTDAIVKALIRQHAGSGIAKSTVISRVISELVTVLTPTTTFTARGLDLIERLSKELSVPSVELVEWIRRNRSAGNPGANTNVTLDGMVFPAPVYERRILHAILADPSMLYKLDVDIEDFSSILVYKALLHIEGHMTPQEVFKSLQDNLPEEDFDKISQFFVTGSPSTDFDTALEIFKLRKRQRMHAHKYLVPKGSPGDGEASVDGVRRAIKEPIKPSAGAAMAFLERGLEEAKKKSEH